MILAPSATTLFLTTSVFVRAEATQEVYWTGLPYQKTFAGAVDVRIQVTGIPAPEVLQVNLSTSSDCDAELPRDGVS